MPSEYEITKRLDIPRDLLWKVITTNSRAFMNHMVKDGALNRMDSTPIEPVDQRPSYKTRKQIYVPKTVEIPAMVRSVVDESVFDILEINDTQKWDDNKPFELNFSINAAVLGDCITMSGTTIFDKCDDGDSHACMQTIRGTCAVDIPFVGWYVEQAIIANMDTFYKSYPQHITNFVTRLVDDFSGDMNDLTPALDRMEQDSVEKFKQSGALKNIAKSDEGRTSGNSDDNDVNVPGRTGINQAGRENLKQSKPNSVDTKFAEKSSEEVNSTALHNKSPITRTN